VESHQPRLAYDELLAGRGGERGFEFAARRETGVGGDQSGVEAAMSLEALGVDVCVHVSTSRETTAHLRVLSMEAGSKELNRPPVAGHAAQMFSGSAGLVVRYP
jgi:hypothetical protein